MVSLLGVLNTYIFTGLTSNLAYDLVKSGWEEVTRKNWNELFFDAFQLAMHDLKPSLSKYGDYLEIDESKVRQVLNQDLAINLSDAEITFLKIEDLSQTISTRLAEKEALVIGGHNLSQTDYEQLVYRLLEQVKKIFRTSILSNEIAFREMVLRQSESNQTSILEVGAYLSKQHMVFMKFAAEIQADLNTIKSDVRQIKEYLGVNRTENEIVQDIEKSKSFSKGKMFSEGLCSGYYLSPKPYQYFIAQEYNANSPDLRNAIENALRNFGFAGVRADDIFESGPLICKIGGIIQSTPFGIFQLSTTQNRNVYLELGISIGLEKPFILIKEKLADVAPILDGIEYFPLNSYLQLQYQLGEKLSPFITNIGRIRHTPLSLKRSGKFALLYHGNVDAVDFTIPIAKELVKSGFEIIIFGDPDRNLSYFLEKEGVEKYQIINIGANVRLDDVISLISQSSFNIFRIDKDASAETFLLLGIVLGKNKDGVLLHQCEPSKLPSDIRGLATIQFTSYSQELPEKVIKIINNR
jgi:hypothetical protein